MSVSFGNWLRQQRIALGLTQQELAHKVGCSAALIRKIEAGERRPSGQIAELLALHLEIAEADQDGFLKFARQRQNDEFPASAPGIHSASITHLLSPLTQRESHILKLIMSDVSDTAIAERLSLKISTVRWYVKQIYSKLGVHSRDEAIALIGESPLLSASQAALASPTPNNLPASTSSFIGRQRQIAEVHGLLLQPQVRLLTLHGPPGIGKTRFSLEIATALLNDFPDGVYFVPLAPLTDPDLVANTIAQPLGVQEIGGQPIAEALIHYLQQKRLLLVLDNFEHLLAATPLVSTLLSAVPTLKILTTSREILNIYGEQAYPVSSLSLPDPDLGDIETLAACESVKLFVQRAQAVKPDFELIPRNANAIADICIRLDGLPLAIELAATRIKLYPPDALIKRLDKRLDTLTGGARDLPERHQTLRSAIAWSYDLLSDDEKKLFARLSVFAGGWTLEALEAVCGPDLPIDLFSGLELLLNKNLVQPAATLEGEPRFTLLETLREYALECLTESGENHDLHRRHASFFLKIAETPRGKTPPAIPFATWLEVLHQDIDNIRSALNWCLNYDLELGSQLIGAIGDYWVRRGQLIEGYSWIEKYLAACNSSMSLSPQALCAVFSRASQLAQHLDNKEALHNYSTALLALGYEQKDQECIMLGLFYQGIYALMEQDFTRATALFEETRTLAGQIGRILVASHAQLMLGAVLTYQKEYERAYALNVETLAMFRQFGDPAPEALLLSNNGVIQEFQGNYQAAHTHYVQSLHINLETNNERRVARGIELLAGLISIAGEHERATQLISAANVLRDFIVVSFDRHHREAAIARLRANLDEATFDVAWEKGAKMTLEQAVACALEPIHFKSEGDSESDTE